MCQIDLQRFPAINRLIGIYEGYSGNDIIIVKLYSELGIYYTVMSREGWSVDW